MMNNKVEQQSGQKHIAAVAAKPIQAHTHTHTTESWNEEEENKLKSIDAWLNGESVKSFNCFSLKRSSYTSLSLSYRD